MVRRPVPLTVQERLVREGVHPVLARILAARGVSARSDLDDATAGLLPPDSMLGIDKAAALLADAIAAKKRLLIVADYDCDGATACAVGVRALRAFGAECDWLVPNRFRTGYGLSPEVVALTAPLKPDVIITVDNGIASVEGVWAARASGIDVVITDHHLPGDELPVASAIVDPNQPGCGFASKHLAGVGVMFYLTLALRAELRKRGAFHTPGAELRRRGVFSQREEPNLAELLDLVALGTVADVVPLDRNNRILVAQGLKRIRSGRMQPGIRALLAVAGREAVRASSFDLGFMVGPRLNAAGRLDDMALGIECLITEDPARALTIARTLDDLNRERRSIEAEMQQQAETLLASLAVGDSCSISLFDPAWHQGVIGILAGRIKDRHHRPVIAFAPGDPGELKGSGRSIRALHMRDALDRVSKRAPGLILRFGGHAAAAGLTIRSGDFARFSDLFEQAVGELVSPAELSRTIETDGSLESAYINLDLARLIESQIWGQGFPQPVFCDEFDVVNQRTVGERHLKVRLARGGRVFEAMHFNALDPLPGSVQAAYRLSVNEFNGAQNLQLVIEHWEQPTSA
ncbi:MAG: single-stranded-DNA-specific exonuclease RecJ [Betaproteobacteria bacterium RIFCSPLOWO2_02_FULL_63_19]|nr:MAG: single-stranded-DNA-specific exonuclease RecJ [Betaproteobacteria bacterium RIFCSPLOWO2_02_FULL_63_19]